MAVPKKKVSKSKSKMRRYSAFLKQSNHIKCLTCNKILKSIHIKCIECLKQNKKV